MYYKMLLSVIVRVVCFTLCGFVCLNTALADGLTGEFAPTSGYWQTLTYQAGQEWIGGPPPTGFRLHADYPASVSDPATAALSYLGNNNNGVTTGTILSFNWVLDTFDVAGGTSVIFNYAGTLLTLVDDITDPLSGSVQVALAPGDQFGWLLSTPVSKSTINFEVDAFEHTVPEAIPGWLPFLVFLGICSLHFGVQQGSSFRLNVLGGPARHQTH
jgi:hypothetical protein